MAILISFNCATAPLPLKRVRDIYDVYLSVLCYIHTCFSYISSIFIRSCPGFFCQIKNERQTVCLGKGKGRRYPAMDLNTERYLQRLYEPHNTALVKMLRNLGYAVPEWLEEDLLTPAEE